MKLTIEMTSTRPMLMHNGRLANPLDPWTQQLKSLTAKRKKTDEDLIAIMRTEARGSVYETPDGFLALPIENVWRCMYDAATAFRRGQDMKRALLPLPNGDVLHVDGAPVKVDDYLSDPAHIDYRPVAVNRAKTMRARCVVASWASVHHFELLEDVVDPHDLGPILERAGRLVGVGDWRPMYGTFVATVEGN